MKKVIGIILMVVSIIAFVLFLIAGLTLLKDGTNITEIIGILVLPAVSAGVCFLGYKLSKK